MEWLEEFSDDIGFQCDLYLFLKKYGASGLEQAMQFYETTQQEYICKTKTSQTKVRISDIYYLEIKEHTISIHTRYGAFKKYGTLSNELKFLSPYGFIKCNQSCIVSLQKIRTVRSTDIILVDGTKIHLSRGCATQVLTRVFSK